MLRKIRRTAAIFCFVFTTLLFLDFTGTLHGWFGWLAKIQFVPALLALNVGVVLTFVLLTLLFGRIYCSIICPLGVFQDIISWIAGKRKKNRFRYSPAVGWLRYGVLVIFIIAFIAGVSSVVVMLEPYSAYGRIVSNLFAPLYQWGNNVLAYFSERINSYAFYSVDVWLKSIVTFAVVVVTFAALIILSWRNGRTYCNTICPVGTLLGFISKFSLFKLTFIEEKCGGCGLCARNCKASCIDVKAKRIDQSRCVTCFDCIEKCKFGAMRYAPRRIGNKKETVENSSAVTPEQVGISRRNVLSLITAFIVTNTIKAQQIKVDGGLATIEDKKIPSRKTPIVPPGAVSAKNLKDHCTACQLCVSACPNGVLRPSSKLATFMQPEMSYERGYCRPECTECSQVCPAGAIKPITTADKSAISIGKAVWIKDNCVVNRDNIQCHNCERHCPTGAISLVDKDLSSSNSLKIPVVNKELCIGCGACENLCPARPFSAIYVEGNVRHHSI
ncbi:4Fe-4S binding protein [uncultured Bacteroides sp.]|uniref:4Fe-4S binding protein n=1 Tax=uncultured Bacteroides sp. TaxID=162156 RepID=UPI002AA6F4FF|nr:4Fe-4S dicluster domain-containing protein [uncultured Bacteroides sp.]